jgi:hypothetical protein
MTHKQKAADRRHGRAASEISCIRNDNKLACKRPATFIPIDEQTALGADAHASHILKRHRYKGSFRWEPIAWYVTLEQCINALADRAVRLSCAQTLAELLAKSQRVISLIYRALPPCFTVEVRP